MLIYATSNRRHLIKETWKDRDDMEHIGDLHRSDSIEEKLSLADRFGVQIYYGKPTREEFHHIVEVLAIKEKVKIDSDAQKNHKSSLYGSRNAALYRHISFSYSLYYRPHLSPMP